MVVSRRLSAVLAAVLLTSACQQMQQAIEFRRAMNDAQLALTAAASCDIALGAIIRAEPSLAKAVVALCKAVSATHGAGALEDAVEASP
jgi:hypothetical protein